jgi:hypothetical protein
MKLTIGFNLWIAFAPTAQKTNTSIEKVSARKIEIETNPARSRI